MTAAELAMVLPLLVILLLGVADFARFAYDYVAVGNAARAGAGFAMMNNFLVGNTLSETAWRNRITQAARDEMTGQVGFNPANLSVSTSYFATGGDMRVQVTASYPFTALVPWPGIPGSLTLSRTTSVRKIR
jgi:Flp pilus assembly protein TadG